MPNSPPDSNGLHPPSVKPSSEPAGEPAARAAASGSGAGWRTNAWLFVATVASVLVTYAYESRGDPSFTVRTAFGDAAAFAAALLSILLAHEFSHYLAARIHKVDASLPYFLPLP